MRLWVLSDLHIDLTKGWNLPAPPERPAFDVLIVAGDLTSRLERGVRWLAERVTDRPVLYIADNHEGYGADIDRTVVKARDATPPAPAFTCSTTRPLSSTECASWPPRCGLTFPYSTRRPPPWPPPPTG